MAIHFVNLERTRDGSLWRFTCSCGASATGTRDEVLEAAANHDLLADYNKNNTGHNGDGPKDCI